MSKDLDIAALEAFGDLAEVVKYKHEKSLLKEHGTPMGHSWDVMKITGHYEGAAKSLEKSELTVDDLYEFIPMITGSVYEPQYLEETLDSLKGLLNSKAAPRYSNDLAGLTKADWEELRQFEQDLKTPSPELIEERKRTLSRIINEAAAEHAGGDTQEGFKAEVLNAHHKTFGL